MLKTPEIPDIDEHFWWMLNYTEDAVAVDAICWHCYNLVL